MTITITHEEGKEVTRENVDRAIDVIERHLEKEARTRNLLNEQAIMRPKDLRKQERLVQVAQLRGIVSAPPTRIAHEGGCTVRSQGASGRPGRNL